MRPIVRFLLVGVVFVVAGYIVYPLVAVGGESLSGPGGAWTFGHYARFLEVEWERFGRSAIWGSVWISLVTVAGSALVGVPLAALFSGPDFPGRRLLGALMVLPMALPPLVGVLAFQVLFSVQAAIPRLFGAEPVGPVPMVLLVHVYSFFVYFYVFTRTGLESLDPSLAEAARSLGAGRFRTLRQVVLPALRPHLLGAALVTFMVSMASFTAPFVFATGKLRVLSVEIQIAREAADMRSAAVQSVLLALVCIGFLLAVRAVEKSGATASKGVPHSREAVRGRAPRAALATLGAALILLALLPHLTLVYISFIEQVGVNSGWTLRHYQSILAERAGFLPLVNSLRLALVATLGTLVFGLAAGYLIGRVRFRGQAALDVGVMLTFALPGTVIAFCLIAAFNGPSWLTGGQVLVGSSGILALAYFLRHIPLAVRPTVAAFRTLDPSLEDAAHSLGASGTQALLKILLPCVLPALLAGCLLGFVTALGEFVSSIMLYAWYNEPVSVAIWKKMDQYQIGQAAAYGVLLMGLVGATLWVYSLYRPGAWLPRAPRG